MKNWKGVLAILLMSVLSLGFSLSAFAAETDALQLKSKSAVLMDAGTGTILYEKNSHEAMPPASVTKVMTLLLIYEAEAAGQFEWEEAVQVSEHAASMGGSQVFLESGETQTAAELTKCIAIASANDAAVAMAEFVAGSEEAFVERMNQRAAELGMKDTVFKNCNGLDEEGHVTSAYDVALMSRELIKHEKIFDYTTIWMDTLREGKTQIVNTNKLLKSYNGITGLKTGTTGGAGICISASATRNGLSLIAVILGAPSSADRFDAATTLLDYGFGAYEAAPLPKLEAQPLQITVRGSAAGSVPLDYSALPETVLVEKGSGASLHTELTLPEELEAPVEQGQTLGKAAVYQGEALLEEYEVRAAADAPRMTVRDAIGLLWQSLTGAA